MKKVTLTFLVLAILGVSSHACAEGELPPLRQKIREKVRERIRDRVKERVGDKQLPGKQPPAYDGSILSIDVNGVEREYIMHVPASFSGAAQRRPLVLFFHGGKSHAEGMDKLSGFNAIADRHGFIVAYPKGIDLRWNDGRGSDMATADDVGFASKLIDHLVETKNVDPHRVYATGISNGAILTNLLACELSHKIAAIAPVAGGIAENASLACNPSRPVSVIMFHGTEDPLVPWEGDTGERHGQIGGKVLSATDTIEFWAAKNQSDSIQGPVITKVPDQKDDGTQVEKHFMGYGLEKSETVLFKIIGGGHTWPGGWQYALERIIGKTNQDINASEIIWAYFTEHPRNKALSSMVEEDIPSNDRLSEGGKLVEEHIIVDGQRRKYLIYLPAQFVAGESRQMPVVFLFHGGRQNAKGAYQMSQMHLLADKEYFMVVYPEGVARSWNTGMIPVAAADLKTDDVGFISSLMDMLEKSYPVDPSRIYATGISNGGHISYHLAEQLNDRIAAIGIVGSGLPSLEHYQPKAPIPAIVFHGTEDRLIPIEGGSNVRGDVYLPTEDVIQHLVKINGASPTAAPYQPYKNFQPHDEIETRVFSSEQGNDVVYVKINGGGHTWPDGKGTFAFLFGHTTRAISADSAMWEFFKNHPKQ